jgi:hypothetical protein
MELDSSYSVLLGPAFEIKGEVVSVLKHHAMNAHGGVEL